MVRSMNLHRCRNAVFVDVTDARLGRLSGEIIFLMTLKKFAILILDKKPEQPIISFVAFVQKNDQRAFYCEFG